MRAGSLVDRRQRAGRPGRAASQQLGDPAAPVGRRGDVDVARQLGDDEADLLRAEARVDRRDHVADVASVADRARRQPKRDAGLESGEASRSSSTAAGSSVTGPLGASRRSALRSSTSAAANFTEQAARSTRGGGPPLGGHDGLQPLELVDQTHDRPRRGAQAGRPVGRGEEDRLQPSQRRVGCRDGGVAIGRGRHVRGAEQEADLRPKPGGHAAAGGDPRPRGSDRGSEPATAA